MLLLAFSVFMLFAIATARAQSTATEAVPNHPALKDRFTIDLGGFYFQTSTQASLTGPSGGAGMIIDFENALGLDERNWGGIGGFLWRISERWRLEVEYFALNRSASRTLGSDIEWNGKPITVGTTVNSSYNFSDARIGLGYAFFKRPDKELGVGVGLHVAGVESSIQAAGSAADSADVLAPLPVVSLYGAFALTNEWAVRFRTDWFSLNYGPYSGGLRSGAIDVLYRPFRYVGFGLGSRTLVFDFEVDKTNWTGKARSTFSGPTAYMTVSF
jgi:hypothetical protein